jgi:mono/diheme cytochrome c family protein
MRKFLIILSMASISAAVLSCTGAKGDYPGDIYAPDMAYSRAFETYAYNSNDAYNALKKRGITYNATPVAGTMARGDMESYPYPNSDSGYVLAKAFKDPYDTVTLSKSVLTEAERIYLVNCGICHGSKLDGNGPLWKDGNGPYPAAPRPLNGDYVKNLSDGQIYHVITYGKGQMGSYASQVHPEQRWWIVKYIRSKAPAATTTSDSTATAKPDSTATAKK